ncbi:serine/threonine protein kinase [Catenulispora sp. GAS73]|uniref:protein kinase domain-containing protein n=1 Tax=Catenulispora sp. GAS73 TaxID=3156269 RepID=UPI0035143C11
MAPLSGDDPRHLGGFRVLTLLAVGGMGRVYLALGPDRKAVALKVARPEFAADARFRARFRREVETAREVGGGGGGDAAGDGGDGDDGGSSAGDGSAVTGGRDASSAGRSRTRGAALIAPVVAADADAELPWLASEYVPGPSVTDAAMEFGPLGDAGLRTLTHGLALALSEVHAAGVVHRDVKPSNVLLARDGPRLIDFGVARAIDDLGLTRVGALIGSPGFLSPEQAVGEPATFGSDVFALAAVVAYAARGQSPFGAGDGAALLYRVVHEPPKLDGLPPDLTEVLSAALAKDPAERPTAPEIAALVAPADPWLPDAVLDDIARREAELAAWLEVTSADPPRTMAVAETTAFDSVAATALDVANTPTPLPKRIGNRRRRPEAGDPAAGLDSPADRMRQPALPHFSPSTAAAAPPDEQSEVALDRPGPPAGRIRQPGLPRASTAHSDLADAPSHSEPGAPATPPGAAYAAFLLDSSPEPVPPPAPAPQPLTHHRAPRRRRFPVYAALGALLGAAVTAGVLLVPGGGHGAPGPSQGPVGTGSADASVTQQAASPTPVGGRSGLGSRAGTTSASGSRR